MSRPILRTARIELRPMTTEHLPLLHRLDSDPEVMRFLLGRARTAGEIDAFWAPRCADTIADAVGLGWWVGFLPTSTDARAADGDQPDTDDADDDGFLGWWDLGRSDSDPQSAAHPDEAEIGWRLEPRRWRQGLATEGAEALLRHGFETVGLERVWAETKAVNEASRGVMRKLGMRQVTASTQHRDRPLSGVGGGETRYEITADEWRSASDRGR